MIMWPKPSNVKLLYRIYRHPIMLFFIDLGYILFFAGAFRLVKTAYEETSPRGVLNKFISANRMDFSWISFRLRPRLLSIVPTICVAAGFGVWLFYVQHTFDGAYCTGRPMGFYHRRFVRMQLYDLPKLMHWLTANIAVPHIHHLDSLNS